MTVQIIPVFKVTNLAKSKEFYTKRLGFTANDIAAHCVAVQKKDAIFHLMERPGSQNAHCRLFVEDIGEFFTERETSLEEWKALGKLWLSANGQLILAIKDTDGNTIELIEGNQKQLDLVPHLNAYE
jgi:catechol 2,3-dioxygenase-like lactoylglutathione lyase family enzyme